LNQGVDYKLEGNKMKTYHCSLADGIRPSPEFHKKGLADYAVNVGLRCGHDCTYCSSRAMLRTHSVFQETGRNAFDTGDLYRHSDRHALIQVLPNGKTRLISKGSHLAPLIAHRLKMVVTKGGKKGAETPVVLPASKRKQATQAEQELKRLGF
jgi:hypothetical protein